MPSSRSEMSYPTMYVDEDQLPEIKDWKPGTEYECMVRIVMTNRNTHEKDGTPKKKVDACLDIRAIKMEDSLEDDLKRRGY